MNALNVLIIVIGILVCFTAIVFKKIFEAILGFVWGFSLSYVIMMLMALVGTSQIRDMSDATAMFLLIAIGIIVAVITVALDRLMITIHSMIISFLLLLLLVGVMFQGSDFSVALIIALVGAVIVGIVMWKWHKYAFIIETAVTGAIMINHFWLVPAGTNYYSLAYGGSGINGMAVLVTIIVAVAGIITQSNLLNRMETLAASRASIGGLGSASSISAGDLINDISDRLRNSVIIKELLSEKIWLLIALLGFIIFPLLDDKCYLFEYPMYNFVRQGCNIMEMVAFGGIIYFACTKKPLTGLVYCIPAVAVRFYTEGFMWSLTHLSGAVTTFGALAVFAICLILKNIITGNSKYFVCMVWVVFYQCFLYAWVGNNRICWPVMQLYYIPILCMVIVLTLMVKIKQNINVFNKVIIAIVVVAAITIVVYQYVEHKKVYNESALGQHKQTDNSVLSNDSDQSNEPPYTQEQLEMLTNESWEVYDTVDSQTGEKVIPMDVFAWALQHTNSLSFDKSGNFEYAIGGTYFSGKYDFNGNKVVLYSDTTSDVIEMKVGTFVYGSMETPSLIWNHVSDYATTEGREFTVYMVTPSFYGG